MAADITISPFTVEVLGDEPTVQYIQLRIVPSEIIIVDGSTGGEGSNRPVSGLVYPRLVG